VFQIKSKNEREGSVVNQHNFIHRVFSPPPHRKHPPRSPTQGVPPERDGNYDKLESVQSQEETLMSTLQFGINIFIGYTSI